VELVDSAGVKIACTVSGDGPAVLMTHGFNDSADVFAANVASLATDHRVVTWDLRGHGSSESPVDAAAYSVEASLDDMAALLDHAGADDAVLLGHSLGGYLSLAFRLVHPSRVRGLVLLGTGPGFRKAEPRDTWNAMAERLAERAATPGRALAARGILPQHDARVIDSLPDVDVPTLVIVGERDEMFVGGSRYMADKIPGARLEIIPGAGHTPNQSHPAEFDAVVRSFLERIGA
jgi:pimeloyl-ACP methyl ester carboxylesterase